MLLGSVAERLQKQSYKTVGEFLVDLQLIFAKSVTYNQVRNCHQQP